MLTDFRGTKKTMRFAQPGFFNKDGKMWYLPSDVIAQSIDTALGIPVILEHESGGKSYGVVSSVYKDPASDWFLADMIITDENMSVALGQTDHSGYGTSNAYNCAIKEGSFNLNGVSYEIEVEGLEFRHLALTKTPRYDGAVILNSKGVKLETIVINGKDYTMERVAECVSLVENMAEVKGEKATGFINVIKNFFEKKEDKKSEEKTEKSDPKKEDKSEYKKEEVKDSCKKEEVKSSEEDKSESKDKESKDEDKKDDEGKSGDDSKSKEGKEEEKKTKDVKNSMTASVKSEPVFLKARKY